MNMGGLEFLIQRDFNKRLVEYNFNRGKRLSCKIMIEKQEYVSDDGNQCQEGNTKLREC